jgi:hypothetical protein
MKKLLVLCLSLVYVFSVFFLPQPQAASAKENSPNGVITPEGAYWEGWKIYSKTQLSDVYGSWINGPSGWGPGTLGWSQSIGVTNTYSGTLKVSKGSVDASVGFNISTSYTRTASYSVTPPSNQQWTIIYRKRYDKWKVTQRKYYHLDGRDYWYNTYEYVYPQKFDNFSYDYKITGYR